MNFKTYLKSKLRYLFSIAMVAALLSQLISPLLSAKADGPRFNFLPGDYQILEGVNTTKGETVWNNPVSGTAGDEFRGSVYYHNGMVDTTATNTKIKVNIPASTTNQTAKITTSISSDNSETVTSTVVNGELIGMNGLVVNLDKDAELELIPGSVRWYPNATSGATGNGTVLPNGQTGNEIVSGNGVNIGDIQGCWQYSGFVTFGFRSKVAEVPAFTINKTVRNVTNGGVQYTKSVSAHLGDQTEFNIDVTNTGNVAMTDGVLKDNDPTGLNFVSGSLAKVSGSTVVALPDTEATKLFNSGMNLFTLAPGATVSFLFKTTVTSPLANGNSATNKASITAFSRTLESSASVNVTTIPTSNIVKEKAGFNNTQNKNVEGIISRIGDTVTYTLTTSNTGDGATDYEIRDNIAEVLTNATVVSISNGGQVVGSDIVWPSVNIVAGGSEVRTFVVKIKNVPANVTFSNIYGNKVTVCVEVPVIVKNPVLSIEKLVRNVTTNDGAFVKSNQANAGDTLEYLISFSNTGNGPADRVMLSDILPANTAYIAGTTRISRNGGSEQTVVDGITGAGIVLDSIPAGEKDFIKIRVITSANLAAGQTLVNTAYINTLSDTASTTIVAKVVPATTLPSLPKTGATSAASFMITLFAGMIVLFAKYRKSVMSEENGIINSLMA